jgi:hypothetical protein
VTTQISDAPAVVQVLEPLGLLELIAPSTDEINRATDANEDPIFTLRLSRPLSQYERRVVALELPTASLHGELDASIGLGLIPSQLATRPQGVLIIVAGISSVATELRAAELEMRVKTRLAAEAVNFLLSAAEPGAAANGHGGHPPQPRANQLQGLTSLAG